jgi:putative SOS response-associated peptidase YedK
MPLLVEPDRYDAWLDPTASDPDELKKLLVPAAPGRLEAYPVSTRVNNVRNNGAELLDPLPPEEERDIDREVGLEPEDDA